MCAGGDAFVDLGMGGSCVQEEAVRSKDTFKDRDSGKRGEV